MTQTILVTGATGHQGTAIIHSLFTSSSSSSHSASPSSDSASNPFHILALTRTPTSPASLSLCSKYPESFLTLVKGNLDDEGSVRSVFEDVKEREGVEGEGEIGGIWGIFCVLQFPGLGKKADGEERQGKLLVDLAREFRVQHFVFSSVERGGEVHDSQAVLDRLAKVRIERYLREGEGGLKWTILRPGFFMENFQGTIGMVTAGVLKKGLGRETKLQLIATSDIGLVASSIFRHPTPYAGKVLVVVGDTLTQEEIMESYRKGTIARDGERHKMPALGGWLSGMLIRGNGFTRELIKDMERVNRNLHDTSTNAPILEGLALTRQAAEADDGLGMTSFEEWVRRRHLGKEAGEAETRKRENWNGVSVGGLVRGKV